MFGEARAQIGEARKPRGISCRNHDIDGGQGMLVQAKGFSRQALDTIAGNGAGAGARRYCQAQPRISFMVCQNRQAKISVCKFFAALPNLAKFGRLVQSLARLERQFTDR
jgi:hypothetical protein